MKKKTPIFIKILLPLMVLAVVEITILVFTLFGQGLIQKLNENETDVLHSRVNARKNYFEGVMVNDWMSLDETFDDIVIITEAYMSENDLTADMLDDNPKIVGPLLTNITTKLIEMMRANRVTGAYVIFNADDISDISVTHQKPGIYIRDHDPLSLTSDQNEDLFLKISPSDVLANIHIPTDSEWDLYFRFEGENKKFFDILSMPYQTAVNGGKYTWKDAGRWSIPQDNDLYKEPILTYTVPLILSDNTVIGVMGIDVTFKYLSSLLPYEELGFDNNAAYILSKYDDATGRYYNTFGTGNLDGLDICSDHGLELDGSYYICSQPLRLYDTNTPFSSDKWVVAGIVKTEYMQAFSIKLINSVVLAMIIALLAGVLFSFLISYLLQKPIAQIAREMESADVRSSLKLTPTGFKEVDAMSEALMKLSDDVIESGRKFSKIIEMSSIHMSGFQINLKTDGLFLTDEFFSVFGDGYVCQDQMSAEDFRKAMQKYAQYVIDSNSEGKEHILCMPINGKSRYIRISVHMTDQHCYGLAEDVTQDVIEKQILQHERDHDPLTSLYNRRAFRSKLEDILSRSDEQLKYSALIMIDLDNLKYFNDTYGHEYGDQYIVSAARAIERCMPENAICARISGDEFNVFLYGFESYELLTEQLKSVQTAVNTGTVELPDGNVQLVHATGGVAYYPEHSRNIEDLTKYADYAMYIAKRNHKRAFQNFDLEMFRSQDIQLRNSESLTKMLQYNLVHYELQPIVDVKTGKIFAYEALMRPDVDQFFTVFEVMETARRDGKLEQVEELTLFNAMKTFDLFIQDGQMPPDTHIFVNSIPNQCVSKETGELFVEKYGKYAKQLVLELTEEEKIDKDVWEMKAYQHRILEGKIALDDYGSGYNSEKTLLDISPDYIKVDMSIIRNIHLDRDKQAIVENIVGYAHDRDKYIIAEGAENEAEVKKLVKLGVDYIQGYFFGKPQPTPQTISKDSLKALGLK